MTSDWSRRYFDVTSISSAAADWYRNYVVYLGSFNVNDRMLRISVPVSLLCSWRSFYIPIYDFWYTVLEAVINSLQFSTTLYIFVVIFNKNKCIMSKTCQNRCLWLSQWISWNCVNQKCRKQAEICRVVENYSNVDNCL